MDYKEKATILRVCSSRKGERCSHCPAFGQGSRVCIRNAMKDGAIAITDPLTRAEAAEARAEKAERERDAAVECIEEIEDALNFKRISAIGLHISEWRGQKEE